MTELAPWARGPFELLKHAEEHHRSGQDFDRRMALVSFDNSIEVSITSYITLPQVLRGGRKFKNQQIDEWKKGFHSKLEFLECELQARKLKWSVGRKHIAWAHEQRNHQYHGGQLGVPEREVIEHCRAAAYWVFSVLYDCPDVQSLVNEAIERDHPPAPQRNRVFDVAIDGQLGTVVVAGQVYDASEVLFSLDYEAYRALGLELCGTEPEPVKRAKARERS